MNRTRLFAIILAVLAVPGLILAWLLAAGQSDIGLPTWTPAEAVRQQARCPPPMQPVPNTFEVTGMREWPTGTSVLYRFECVHTTDQRQIAIGHHLTRWTWAGWRTIEGTDSTVVTSSRGVNTVAVTDIGKGSDTYTLVHGSSLQSGAVLAEVHFANGRIRQDSVTNSVFAILLPDVVGVCAVHLLDEGNAVIAQYQYQSTCTP